jgi:hypothetical protein
MTHYCLENPAEYMCSGCDGALVALGAVSFFTHIEPFEIRNLIRDEQTAQWPIGSVARGPKEVVSGILVRSV